MKYLPVLALSLCTITMAHAETCKTSTNIAVRGAPNGNVIGHLKSSTAIRVVDYTLDNSGRSWAYIYWQGQPLKSPYNGNLNAGWIAREAVICQ